jgi:hypothetical protein
MKLAYFSASDFPGILDTSEDKNSEKSFAQEIAEKNKQIREEHREIIQETIDNPEDKDHPSDDTDKQGANSS